MSLGISMLSVIEPPTSIIGLPSSLDTSIGLMRVLNIVDCRGALLLSFWEVILRVLLIVSLLCTEDLNPAKELKLLVNPKLLNDFPA